MEDCYATYHKDGQVIEDEDAGVSYGSSPSQRQSTVEISQEPRHQQVSVISDYESSSEGMKVCERCGRDSHIVEDCYATYHKDGQVIEDEDAGVSYGSSPSQRQSTVEIFSRIKTPASICNFRL